jgi:hypothetical protein
MALRSLRRWVLEPAWTAAPEPRREEWSCPACGRTVWRANPAWKGIWFAPVRSELVTRCARQHGAHDRHGAAFVEDRTSWAPVVGLSEQAALEDADDRRVPVVALADGGFVALLPPAGVRVRGDGVVEALDDLQPSDLVGRSPRAGRPVGRVAPGSLVAEAGSIDARALRDALLPGA